MTGISQIAEGDDSEFQHLIVPNIPIEELHPDDQDLIWWWEMTEPALSPHSIDPVARAKAEKKRHAKTTT